MRLRYLHRFELLWMVMAAELALQVVFKKNDMAEHEVAVKPTCCNCCEAKGYAAVTAELELPEGVGIE